MSDMPALYYVSIGIPNQMRYVRSYNPNKATAVKEVVKEYQLITGDTPDPSQITCYKYVLDSVVLVETIGN